ncbi:hypothetical protein [Nonomuraea zeae]
MRSKTTGFSAVIPTSFQQPWKLWFLRGEEAALIDTQALQWQKPLSEAFDGAFTGLPEPFASCSDGAFYLHHKNGNTLFLAGDQCLEWNWGDRKVIYQGPITGFPEFGPHIPAAFRSDIDIAMQLPTVYSTRRTLLIKGDQCAIVRWGEGVGYQGPLSEMAAAGMPKAGWKMLPKDMSGDFDHAVLFVGSSATDSQTLFIKGDQAMYFDWEKGPIAVGTWGQAMTGLGALPADYHKPRLPAAGRFSGITDGLRVDLRVDLEGELPVVSGDLFYADGDYYNSFILDGNQAVTLPATITGTAKYATNTSKTKISVVVDKLAPGGIATLTRSEPDGSKPTTYTCAYTSRFLRTIDWEVDAIKGTTSAPQYFTGAYPRPPGLAKKLITVQSAFADVGIELRMTDKADEIDVNNQWVGEDEKAQAGTEEATNLRWSNAELHAAMVSNFSGYRDTPQWKLWGFAATRYVDDGTRGVMFDFFDGHQRQGLAMFHDEMKNEGARDTLRTWVHEIGHAFNLNHSWEKNADQLGPRKGHGDLSWMNYPTQYWPSGDETGSTGVGGRIVAYWQAFAFQFTDGERRHLRHGFYNDLVMGGRGFGTGAADRPALQQFDLPPASRSGLRLELSGRDSFSHGEPVVTEIKLSLDGSTAQADAFPDLSPRGDNLTILVTDPAGAIRPFRPIARACGSPDHVTLDASTPALYDSAYLGYGADGLTFPTSGTYQLRALYKAPDGSTVTSPEHAIEVNAPRDEQDQQAGDLLIGSQQGTLLALLGSDTPQLQEGNDALDTLIADHGDHPLAVYARMVKGTNAGRHFLTLGKDGISVRRADTDTSIEQLSAVVETTLDPGIDAGVDNITLNETMRRLARAHARAGDLKQADVVLDQLVDTFRDKDVPPPVLATIVEQAETTRAQLHDQA